MSRQTYIQVIIMSIVSVLFTSCGNTPPSASPQANESSLKFYVLSVDSIPADNGWKDYTIKIAVENQGDAEERCCTFEKLGRGTVDTQEGFTYVVNPPAKGEAIIPPKLRVVGYEYFTQTGTEKGAISFSFRAAATAHPLRIRFSQATLDLNVVPAPIYPTDLPKTAFKNMGETINVHDKANITFEKIHFEKEQGLIVDAQLQNLDQGYDTYVGATCLIVDNIGYVRLLANSSFPVHLGPGQTQKTQINIPLPEKSLLTNAKLSCSAFYQKPDKSEYINTIFNVD